jgi:hypothetical protein
MFVWLVMFAVIGLYQRRKTHWPERPPESATPDDVHAYRVALERRRDEQRRWPARRLPVLVGTVTIAFVAGLVRLFAPHGGPDPLMSAFAGAFLVVAVACAMYAFTLKLTNRAAADFQRELDAMPRKGSSERD